MSRASWYRRALAYLPDYTKARVHLAEVCSYRGCFCEAEALLLPALSRSEPEVRWRLGDALIAQGRVEEGRIHLEAARCGFNRLLEARLLAFADHAAEFYRGSGNDPRRALELARANAVNRPTRRSIGLARTLAGRVEHTTRAGGWILSAASQTPAAASP